MQADIHEVVKHYPEFTGVHPACIAVPPASEEDYQILLESIKANGLRESLLRTKDGKLLDGRTRLLACYEAGQEIHVVDDPGIVDPWVTVAILNIDRRQLTTGQRAAYADAWREHEEAAAKERQKLSKGRGQKGVEIFPHLIENTGKSRDLAGQRVGVSGKTVDKYRIIAEFAPEAAEQVKAGTISLQEGYKMALVVIQQQKRIPVDLPIKPDDSQMADIVTAAGVVSKIKLPKHVRFNSTNDSVDWASWTWNPVTGCDHGCSFCYARAIANQERMAEVYPNKFEPTFHPYRLEAPKNTPLPKQGDPRDFRVFVCSMADLFGKWVPAKWINSVFDACREAPDWEYLFLTKWPARYSQMPLLQKAWYGASVVKQADVKRVESAMQKIEHTDGLTRWISMEPMLEPIVFSDLSWCDLMVIGSQTSTYQPWGFEPAIAPEFDWIVDVVNQCREANVPYYLKANLGMMAPGMELPKNGPR